MRLENIAGLAFGHIFGRMVQRALLALAIVASGIVAIYYFTAAGSLALEAQYGEFHARLIIGVIYLCLAVVSFTVFWAMRGKPVISGAPTLNSQRDMQIAMLVEAVMLGFALAKKSSRAS